MAKGQIGIIAVIIILLIVGIITIWSIATIIETFKLAIVAILMPFVFLWFYGLFKKNFKVDKYPAMLISAVVTLFIGIAVYQSIYAIIALGIIIAVAYFLWARYANIRTVGAWTGMLNN